MIMSMICQTTNYLIEEITQNELMSKHKKVYRVLNYIKHLLIIISRVSGCVSISVFPSLVSITMGVVSSAIRLKICVITAGIKKCKSTANKKEAW